MTISGDGCFGGDVPTTTAAIDAMLANLTPYSKRYLLMTLTSGNATRTHPLNVALVSKYGAEHVADHRTYLVERGLADAGITPTQADLDAMAQDRVPPSLTWDGVHFVQAAYTVIGKFIANTIRSRNWA